MSLVGMNLENRNFQKKNLQNIDFSKANLKSFDFQGADLRGANFFQADLRGANFFQADLRGANFFQADLRGANFFQADLRGANFLQADLRGTNFSEALAGIPLLTSFYQFISILIFSALFTFCPSLINAIFLGYFFQTNILEQLSVIPALSGLAGLLGVFWSIHTRGLTFAATIMAASSVAMAGLLSGITAGFASHSFITAGFVAGSAAGLGMSLYVFSVIFSAVFCIAEQKLNILKITVVIIDIFAAILAVLVVDGHLFIGAVITFLLNFFVAWRTMRGDNDFLRVRKIAVNLSTIGGTNFSNSNLNKSEFCGAMLNNTNFKGANLTHVNWRDAKSIDLAYFDDLILSNKSVRDLLITGQASQKSYFGISLSNTNLNSVDLSYVDLKQVNLTNTILRNSNLEGANLAHVLAMGADFSNSTLTGACIESWNIDQTTTLENINCLYVFLLEKENQYGSRERRPHDPSSTFQPGDFEKIYRKVLATVEVILRGGISVDAIDNAIKGVMDDLQDSEISVLGCQKKDEDFLLTLKVNERAEKSKIEKSFLTLYENRLNQVESKIKVLESSSGEKSIHFYQPISVIGESKHMSHSSNSSQDIKVSGDFNLSSENSVVNLGNIYGSVTNAIGELSELSNECATSLSHLLSQLQSAILEDEHLEDPDKQEALSQILILAKSGKKIGDKDQKSFARTAIKILRGTISILPVTSQFLNIAKEVIPSICKTLGLS